MLNLRITTLQLCAVLAAMLLYGALGQPTPDQLGITEIVIALLLIAGAGAQGASNLFILTPRQHVFARPAWFNAGQLFALYGLTVPLLIAVFGGADIGEAARDIIAFAFILLPLLYWHLFREARGFRRLFFLSVLFIGLAFSLRIFLPLLFPSLGISSAAALYLTITPAVLFAALYFLAAAYLQISWRYGYMLRHICWGVIFVALALFPICAVAFALQRASVAAVLIFAVFGFIYVLLYRPETVWRLAFLLALLVLALFPYIQDILLRLETKHLHVGFNSRGMELKTVIDLGLSHWGVFLFGHGWGALFENPAVGNMKVGYTHNVFSYYFFKTGALGLVLLIGFWLSVMQQNLRLIRINPPLGMALFLPLMISSFFYASHKAFSYGVLILLVCALTRRPAPRASRVEPAADLVYSGKP
ncbi:MAG: hypothetical protein CL561_02805 [Alphaproteobacteria bacterium]|nr:hypothetical protein [Alphaproteobacteria bacterium]